jgi:hypothetical protein
MTSATTWITIADAQKPLGAWSGSALGGSASGEDFAHVLLRMRKLSVREGIAVNKHEQRVPEEGRVLPFVEPELHLIQVVGKCFALIWWSLPTIPRLKRDQKARDGVGMHVGTDVLLVADRPDLCRVSSSPMPCQLLKSSV